MKSFFEVIQSIKNGEVYNNGIYRIENVNGTIQISRFNGVKINDYILCFSNLKCYKKEIKREVF